MFVTQTSRLGRLRGARLGAQVATSGPMWSQYQERVIGRHGGGRYTILLRPDPLMHGLGSAAVQAISSAAGIGTKIATPSIISATGVSGLAAGALTAGIGAGVAVLVGVLASLWSAHEARIKGATQENQAINSAVQTFDAGLKAIFAAANSSNPGQYITGAQAAQYTQQLLQQFFAQMAPFTHAPGAADASGGGASCGNGTLNPGGACTGTPGGHMCNAQCTATCCVGCQDLYPTVLQAQQVFASPTGGTITACTVYSSKYGAAQRGSYSLTYKPPAIATPVAAVTTLLSSSPSAVAAGVTSLATSVGTVVDTPVAGIPLWMILLGGGAAYLAFR